MKTIEPTELRDRLTAGEPVEVVDIREEPEFRSWHILGSRNVPVYDALRNDDPSALVDASRGLPRDRSIVTVCRAGVMSQRAAQLLESLGFRTESLAGGIRGWGGVWTEARIDWPSSPAATLVQIRRNGKGCLSYLFGANGRAAVVDPSVETGAYTAAAHRAGLEIAYVLETHVHADHLSRARQLASTTGATLILPPNDRVRFDYTPMPDGATIDVGGIRVEAVATPGHTGESTCYLVGTDLLLTGDTLFVERVGRPDLEKGDAGAEAGARLLYRSLHALLERFDDVRILPAHTADPVGFDGVPVAATLAEVRDGLSVTREDEERFVQRIVQSLEAKPPNHESVIAVNEGRESLEGIDPLDLEAGPNRCAAG